MASQIVLWNPSLLGDPDGRYDYRWENTVNSPITSAEFLGSGQEIADTYELTFTLSGGVTVAVVCGADTKNPFQDTGVAITADAATWNYVVPGWRFKVSASVDTGWKAKFANGVGMTAAGVTTNVLNEGVIQAGSSSTAQQISGKNVGDADSVTTKLRAIPARYWTPLDKIDLVEAILPHTDDSREHTAEADTYLITFQNLADGTGDKAGFKVVDIYVQKGSGANEKAVNDAMFDGVTDYQYGHADYDDAKDKLKGMRIRLAANASPVITSVTITLVVQDGAQYVELAPDVAGSPGSYTSGDLTLTESGQQSGTIRAGQSAKFWEKWSPPGGAQPGAIRGWDYATRGLTV
jgi:hypothetical protein